MSALPESSGREEGPPRATCCENPQRSPSARWVVYLLECGDRSLYVGVTNDLGRRLAAHASGRGARYTRGRGPLVLRWSEPAAGKSQALSREAAIRKLSRREKLALIGATPPVPVAEVVDAPAQGAGTSSEARPRGKSKRSRVRA